MVYCLIDGSPQGGRDYEVIVLLVVRKSCLAEMHALTEVLKRSLCLGLDERVDTAAEESELLGKYGSLCGG